MSFIVFCVFPCRVFKFFSHRFLQNKKKGKGLFSYADIKANVLVELDRTSMVCEVQFLMNWMIAAKKRGHSIYEVQRNLEFVENVHTLSSLYTGPNAELLAIAIRQDATALSKFMVNNPNFEYFPGVDGTSSLIHYLTQNGGVKLVKLLLSILPPGKDPLEVLNCRGENGLTPFMLAGRNNRLDMAKVCTRLFYICETSFPIFLFFRSFWQKGDAM